MYIFIDTNIFFGNWHLNNPNFILLFNFIENSQSTLLFSELVIQEIENIYQREWTKNTEVLNKATKHLSNLSGEPFQIEIKQKLYSFKTILGEKVNNIIYMPYDEILHTTLVKRAIQKIKPFQENEKGYRDTLIWLSFLTYLKNNPNKIRNEVAFITNNSNDFGDKNSGFYESLKSDITEFNIKPKITLYNSIQAFIENKIPKEEHTLTYNEIREKYLYRIESAIENRITETINELTSDQLESIATNWHRNLPIRGYILSQYFEIDEGIEDLEVLRYKELPFDTIYINCQLQLKRCSLYFNIPSTYYASNKNSIDQNYDNVVYEPDETTVTLYPRTYLDLSITMDKHSKRIDALEIERIEFH